MDIRLMNKTNQAIKIISVQANSLYLYNEYRKDSKNLVTIRNKDGDWVDMVPRLDIGKAVLNDSIFTQFMKTRGAAVSKNGSSKTFIVLKFDYGVKGVMSANELREYYYKNGVDFPWEKIDKDTHEVIYANIVHYKMLMRNSGKAKDGDCIFIVENLHEMALKYITMDLFNRMPEKNAKIVELSAYSTLITATAIDYITIPLNNIFVVEDEEINTMKEALCVKTKAVPHTKTKIDFDKAEGFLNKYGLTFYKKKQKQNPDLQYVKKTNRAVVDALAKWNIDINLCPTMEVTYYKNECCVDRENGQAVISNILWDGMGVIDDSIFPQDKEGFIYCRSHFFKSCLFRGNVQDYFKDYYGENYEHAYAKDMFGRKIKVTDIKVIVSDKSLKWLKFKELMGDTLEDAFRYYYKFMKKDGEQFEIVKTAHASKWGNLQRDSYQINNSQPCTDKEKLEKIAKPTVDYINSLKTNHDAFMHHLEVAGGHRYSFNNVLIALDGWNDKFRYTRLFKNSKDTIISDFKNERAKLGKLFQEGDNLTICGNVIALLKKVTGQDDFLEEGCFENIENGIQCYTKRFEEDTCIAAYRSPHNSPNNIIHLVNVYPSEIEKYFPKLGKNVIIINGIGTDVQSRLNGQDLDTDSVFATNQPEMVELAKYAYMNYPTIVNGIDEIGSSSYTKDMQSYAKMDNSISSAQYAIGYASNVAQLALSYYFDGECKCKELEDVFIISSVLAQVAIDSAKRTYNVNVNTELNRLSHRDCMLCSDRKPYPEFYAKIQEIKNRKSKKKRKEIKKEEIRKFNCPMEILADVIEGNVLNLQEHKEFQNPTCKMKEVFVYTPNGKRDNKQYDKVMGIVGEYSRNVDSLDGESEDYVEKVMSELDDCMLKLNKLNISKNTMMSLVNYALGYKKGGESYGNKRIGKRMLTMLYDKDPDKFLSCFIKSPTDIEPIFAKTPTKMTGSLDL